MRVDRHEEPSLNVRLATHGDAGAINAIYNPFIRESPATFETEPYSLYQREQWLSVRAGDARYPVFLAERAGEVVGFASSSPFDPRAGYATSVKTSVFIANAAQRAGAGKKLYTALFDALAATDLHRAYALVVAPNAPSVALHEHFGFCHISTLSEVGRKFDRYYDVMWFEKAL